MTLKWFSDRKEILFWGVAGLCLLGLSFLWTFPYEALHLRALAELHRSTGMEVRVTDWGAELPLGLQWRNITLSKPELEPIQIDFLRAKVHLGQALTGKLGVDVEGRIDEGNSSAGLAKATVKAPSFTLDNAVTVKGEFQQIDLSRILRPHVTNGLVNGNFSHRLFSAQGTAGPIEGEGTWRAEVHDLAVEDIPAGNGRTLALAFTNISAGLSCKNRLCTVTELKGDGIDGSFTGEGTITLRRPMEQSQLALAITVIPGAGFASKAAPLGIPPIPPGTPMTVKLVGTLAQTRLAL